MIAKSKAFRIKWGSEPGFEEALGFASEVGRERVISISHSDSHVVVWYWDDSSSG